MSAELVDERVVEMRFDNKDFEKNVGQSIKTINKLKDSLDFEESEKSFENISKAAAKCDMKPLEDSLESVSVKFSMLEMVAANVLSNIVNKAVDAGIKFAKSMSVDQITAGWSKYEQKTQSVQTIMAATGLSIDEVNSQLEKLIWFADETSYSFTDMVNNVGKFTSAGVDIETAVDSMMGISNWAALSGAGIQQASRAMYNLSQAMGMGYVGIQDWKSIELANMATLEFKQTIIDTAVELGTLQQAADGTITTMKGTEVVAENMRETLKEKWFTGDVLNVALNEYSSFANAVRERQEQWADEHNGAYLTVSRTIKLLQQEGYEMDSIGARAFQRAQEAITLTQAIAATTDAVSSGWMRTFEIIFGNYDQAKRLWTDLANDLWDIFASGSERRNDSLSNIFESNYQKMLNSMPNASEMNDRLYKKLFDMASINHGEEYAKALFSEYDSLEELLKNNADSIYSSTLEKAFFQVSEDLIKESQTAENLYKELTEGRLTLKQAAIRLAQGQYGTDVEAQKKAVETLGFEYEYLLDYAEAWKEGLDLDWKEEQKALEEHLQAQTQYCKDFAKELKKIDPFSGFFEGLMEKGGRDKLIGGFQNILKTFKNVYLTIIEIKNGISDLTGTSSFLGTIIDGFYKLTEVFAYLDDEFEIVQESIYNFFHGGLQKMWTDFWSGGYVVKQGQQVWDHLTEQYVDLVEFVPGIFERVKNAYDNYLGRIPENISKSIENIRTKVFGFFGSIPERFKNLTEQIFGKLESTSVVDVITGKTTQAYHITGGFLNNLKDSIRGLGGGFGGKMIDGLAAGLSRIGDIIFGYEKDGEKIQGIIVPIYDKVTALWQRLKDIGKVISDTFSSFKSSSFFTSIHDFIFGTSSSSGVKNSTIEGLYKQMNLLDRIKYRFGQARGALFGYDYESYSMEDLEMKIVHVEGKLEKLTNSKPFIAVKQFFTGGFQNAKNNFTNIVETVKESINNLLHDNGYNSLHDFFFGNKKIGLDSLPIRILDDIKKKFEELKKNPIINTIISFIEQQIAKIKELINNAGGSVSQAFENVKKYLFGYDVKKDGFAGFIGQMEHVDGLIDKIKNTVSSFMGSLFKKDKKSLLEQLMDTITGPGKAMTKVFGALRLFILSLSGINVALLGLNLEGFGFKVKSPFAEIVDIVKEFAIAVTLVAASFIGISAAIKKFDLTSGDIFEAAMILASIMAALMACAVALDKGTETASLKDIIAQSITTVPMLKTLAMILAEIAGLAIVFAGLAKLVGVEYVMAGVFAMSVLLLAIGGAIALLYLPDLKGKKDIKSKAGDLIGITFVLISLVPFLLTLGAVIAEMALIATLIPKNLAILISFGVLVVAVIGSIAGILLALSKFSGKGISASAVISLAIISIIIGQIGLIIGSFAILSKLLGKGNMWRSFAILELVMVTVFGFIFGMSKWIKDGVDASVIFALGAVIALIQVIGDVIETLAKTIKNTGSENAFSAFGIIVASLVTAFLAIKGLSKVDLTGDEIWNVIKMMGLMGLLALEVWGLIAIANKANITSYDALLPMLAAIGELAVTMIILGAVIGTIGRLGDKVLAALPQALAGIFAVSVGIVAIGSAFILINKAFTWLSDSIGGESISDSTDKIIEFLVSIMHGIGEMVGALIGGIGEGISDSLPTIGANISAFTEKLKPFFEFIAGLKEAHAAGAVIFTGVMVSIVTDEILAIWQRLLSNFTGDMSSTGTNLSDFTDNLNRFFNNIVNLKEEHLSGAKVLTAVMAEIVKQDMLLALENILTWFQGKVNFDTFVTNLNTIADGVVEMDGKLAGIDKSKADNDIAIIKSILDFLTDDSYKTGGIAGFVDILINGSTKFKDLFKKLNTDVVSGFKTFCTNVAYVNVDNAKKAAEILPVIMDMLTNKEYRTGGISGFFDMITNGTTDFEGMFTTLNTKILPGLRDFASGLSAVDDTGNSLDYSGISNAAEAMKALMDLMSMDASNLITDKESKFLWWKVDDSDATKIGESFKVIEDAVVPAITGLQDALMGKDIDAEFMKGTVGVFQSLVQTLMDFSQLGLDETTVKNIGSYIITGLVTALDEGVDLVREAATRVANGIVEGLTLTLQIQSPSRVARDIGEFAYQGLIEGIEAGDDKAYKVAQMLGMEVARGLKDSIPKKIEAPELDTDPFLGHASDATEGMFAYLKYGLSADSFKNGGFDISYDSALEAAKKAGDDSAVKYLEAFEGKIKNVRLEKDSVTDMFKQFGISGIEEFIKGDYASQIARNMVTNLGADIFGESAEFLDFDMDQVTEVLSGLGPFGELFAGAISDLTVATDKAKEATKSETKVNVDSSQVEEAVNWLDVLSEQYKVTDTQLTTQASLKLQKGEKLTEKEAMALQNVWDGVMLGMYGSGEKRIEELQKLGVDWYSLFALSDSRGGLDWSNSVNTALEYADTVIALGNDYKTSDLFKDIAEGKWGEGADRLKALEKAGYDAEKVQKAFAKWYSDPSYDPGDYYGKVTDEEKELAEQTEKLNEVLNSTPEGAFRTVADFLEGVAKVIEKDEVSTKFKEFMTSVDESMSGVKLDNASDFEKVANFLNAIRTTAKESTGIATDFATFMENINGSLNTLNGLNSGEEDSDPIGDLVSKINGMPDLDTAKTQPLVDFLNNVMNAALAISNSTLNATIMTLADAMIKSFEGYYSSFKTLGETAVLNIIAGMESKRTAAMQEGGTIAGSIMSGFGDAMNNAENQQIMSDATDALQSAILSGCPDGYATGLQFIINYATAILENKFIIEDAWNGVDSRNAGKNITFGLGDGIVKGAMNAEEAMHRVDERIKNKTKDDFIMQSPSKLYAKYGEYVVQGFANGVNASSNLAVDAITGMADGTNSSFTNIISALSSDIEDTFNNDAPVIRPVVDMSDVYNSASNIDAALSRDRAFSISAGEYNKTYQNGVDGNGYGSSGPTFIQNNYSPKPLSRLEIYRQTKNQFAMMQNT